MVRAPPQPGGYPGQLSESKEHLADMELVPLAEDIAAASRSCNHPVTSSGC